MVTDCPEGPDSKHERRAEEPRFKRLGLIKGCSVLASVPSATVARTALVSRSLMPTTAVLPTDPRPVPSRALRLALLMLDRLPPKQISSTSTTPHKLQQILLDCKPLVNLTSRTMLTFHPTTRNQLHIFMRSGSFPNWKTLAFYFYPDSYLRIRVVQLAE